MHISTQGSSLSGPLTWRRFDWIAVCFLIAFTLAIGLADPNDQFLSTNDIYIFRQIHVYFDLFSWLPQDVSSWSAVFDKLARFVFWFFYYFHGAPPQLYQAPIFALMDAAGASFRPLYGQAMVTVFLAVTIVMFWSCLRRASVSPAIAIMTALIIACSPMLTSFSRGFGTMWLVNAAFCQVSSVYAVLRLREGRGGWVVGLLLTHIILSDPISFLIFGAVGLAWIMPDRWTDLRAATEFAWGRLRMLSPLNIWLLPLLAVSTILLWNVLRARYAAAIPGEQTLFVYPFVKYIAGAPARHTSLFGPLDWLRVAVVSLGVWAPFGFPAVLGVAASVGGRRTADPFLLRWALISSAGFGLMFYVFAFEGMGSQQMPYVGYPVYTIIPFATLLALAADRIGSKKLWRRRIAAAMLAIFAAAGLLTTINYIWQRPLVPGSTLLAFDIPGMDFIGLRRPYYGDEAAGAALRYVLSRKVNNTDQTTVRLLYVRKPDNVRFDAFWMYAGLEYGGRWFEFRYGSRPKVEAAMLEHESAAPLSDWQFRRIEPVHRTYENSSLLQGSEGQACAALACVVLDTTGKASDEEMVRRLASAPDLQIRRDGSNAYDVSIIGDRSLLPETGVTDGRDLERQFRRDFPSLWDYIPPRKSLYFLNKIRGGSEK